MGRTKISKLKNLSERELLEIFGALADVVVEIDKNEIIKSDFSVSQGAGDSENEAVVGKSILDFFTNEGPIKFKNLIRKLKEKKESIGRIYYVNKEGSHCEIVARAIISDDEYTGAFVILKNLSAAIAQKSRNSKVAELGSNGEVTSEKALSRQSLQQELVTKISMQFASTDNIDVSINKSIFETGKFLGVDRIFIFKDYPAAQAFRCVYEWVEEGFLHILPLTQNESYKKTDNGYLRLKNDSFYAVSDTAEGEGEDIKSARALGIKAFVHVPVIVEGAFWGYLGVDSCKAQREWKQSELNLLVTISGQIATAIEKSNIENALLDTNKMLEDNITELVTMSDTLMVAMEQAKEASKAKSEFLSRTSHEIRTPMNAITGLVTICKKSDSIDDIKKYLDKVEGASHQLLGLINNILDISKIESGKFELYNAEFDLSKCLDNIRSVITVKADEKHQTLICDFDFDKTRKVCLDELRFNQVVINLLSNAVKFTPVGGKITLKVYEDTIYDQNVLSVSVSDNGIGMSIRDQNRLFEPFEQADGSITRRFGGTGLGLAICKNIVTMMGGEISVASEMNEGSTFSFYVSYEKGGEIDKDDTKTEDTIVPKGSWKGKTILVAEDIEISREILQIMLEDTGIRIDTAENGKIAFEMFLKAPKLYNLILMDIQMPVMDGYECTKLIRNIPLQAAQEVPIIAMTANAFTDDVARCLEAGMNGHIAKPVDINHLISVMISYFSAEDR